VFGCARIWCARRGQWAVLNTQGCQARLALGTVSAELLPFVSQTFGKIVVTVSLLAPGLACTAAGEVRSPSPTCLGRHLGHAAPASGRSSNLPAASRPSCEEWRLSAPASRLIRSWWQAYGITIPR
jgi:hypothetical protein